MSNIYDQHNSAFRQVQAYVILKGSERVATIAFKFPHDGAGRLYAYVHWLGAPMVRGYANGYGYDKRSAAVESAVQVMLNPASRESRMTSNGTYFATRYAHAAACHGIGH